MDINEVRSLKYREIVHYPHPVFKGTCVHWRVNGEIVEYKKTKMFRLPLKYGYYVYSEINNHNFELFHRECSCPNSNSYFKPDKKNLPNLPSPIRQQVLPFSPEDKKRKGVNLT